MSGIDKAYKQMKFEPLQNHEAYKPSALEMMDEGSEEKEEEVEALPPLPDPKYPQAGVKILMEAAEAISTSRNDTHGPKDRCFRAMAIIDDLFTEMTADQIEQKPELAAARMIGYKLARILAGQSDFEDHWKDMAGYAGCGWECIVNRKGSN